MQDRPELVLAQTGPHRLTEAGHGELGRADRCAHALQFLLGLDRAGALDRRLGIGQVKPLVAQRQHRPRVDALDSDGGSLPAMLAHESSDLFSPSGLDARDRGASSDITDGDRRANLVDRLEPICQMRAAGELVQDDRARLRDEQVARWIARVETCMLRAPVAYRIFTGSSRMQASSE